jgi:hypothetical protein
MRDAPSPRIIVRRLEMGLLMAENSENGKLGNRLQVTGDSRASNTKTNSNTLLTTEDTEGHGGKARPRLQITGDRLQQT